MNLSPQQIQELLQTLANRFHANISRHPKLDWTPIQAKLKTNPNKLSSLYQMETTLGEPDVIGQDPNSNQYIFCDCSLQTPKGRVSLCYDQQALESRKQYKPQDSVINMANNMGIELLNENQYKQLQKLGAFDTKTSSWILTPPAIRKLGDAIFADRRYNHVFIYHNGAESYYASRGFRGLLKL